MRTTVDLDEDVLVAAKALSRAQRRTLGQVLSEAARKGILQGGQGSPLAHSKKSEGLNAGSASAQLARLGVHPFPYTGGPLATNQLVNQIRDQEGI
ncbi:MAG: hypothetical protein VW440_04165 [Bordetella sp.]